MWGQSALPRRPRRRRGISVAAGIVLAAGAVASLAPARAEAALSPQVGVQWFATPGGDAAQCGNPTSSAQWVVSPGWTSPIRVDTDSRVGGCELSFGIYDPSEALTGDVYYGWHVDPGGDGGQCGNQGSYRMPVNWDYGLFGPDVVDDTDNRTGYCNLTFTVSSGSNFELDVQYFTDPGGSDGQCVNALPQGDYYAVQSNESVTIGLDTDDRPGGCWLSFRLR
jgi:hypothetical protein